MKSLYAKGPAELVKILKLEKSYQAKQIYSWLIKGVTDYSLMSDVSKKIRDRLTEEFPSVISSKIVKTQKADSATKLLIELHDGVIIVHECYRGVHSVGLLVPVVAMGIGLVEDCSSE